MSRAQRPHGYGRAPGKIRLKALLFVLVLVAAVYVGIQFIPPYWIYLSMQDPVKEAAMTAVMTRGGGGDAAARAEVVRRARDLGLRLEEKNIEIDRQGPLLVIRVSWVAPVDLPRYRHHIRFLIEQRVPLP